MKRKLERFAEMMTFPNVLQPAFDEAFRTEHALKGNWKKEFFGNTGPVILELGCGKGEYTLGLAKQYPNRNFLGMDIKGARIWRGAKTALQENITNVGFLRTRIEFADAFFAPGEVDEIWITFPDPQPQKKQKRLTSPKFLNTYRNFLAPGGIVHLKTDNRMLYQYTMEILQFNHMEILRYTDNLYASHTDDPLLSIKTFYESQFLAKGLPIHYLRFRLPHDKIISEIPAG